MKTTVVTAIYGGHDTLRTPRVVLPGVEYLCFTDDPALSSDVWTCIVQDKDGLSPLMAAKRHKIMPHKWLNTDRSIWIDGHCTLTCDPERVWGDLWYLSQIGLVRHWRDCIYTEADECRARKLDRPALIRQQTDTYRRQKYPRNSGLYYGGFVLRYHTDDTAHFNANWWRHVTRFSARDQISLPVALAESRVHATVMQNRKRPRFFEVGEHE